MNRQYPLPLPHSEAMGTDDFMVTACNRDAFQWVAEWPNWPVPVLVIHGPSGCGKTHLAEVWRARSGAQTLSTAALSTAPLRDLVAQNPRFIVEDAQVIGGDASAEEALFHLFNMVRETKGALLLTAPTPPAQWNIKLADLRSRLLSVPVAAIAAPEDELLSALLVKQFHDRQISVDAGIVDYVLPRLERTTASIRAFVEAADKTSLAERRGITVALARRILEEQLSLPSDAALD